MTTGGNWQYAQACVTSLTGVSYYAKLVQIYRIQNFNMLHILENSYDVEC